MITAGTHKAIVVGAYIGESATKKTPYYGIEFQIEETNENIDWLAYLADGSKERNLNTLLSLGFKGGKLSDLADTSKKMEDLFEFPEDDIFIVVEIESYEASDGTMKDKAVVSFVNIGQRNNITKFDHKQAVAVLKSHSFDGDLQRIKKAGPSLPAKKVKPATQPAYDVSTDTNFTSDDIPF